MLRLSTRSRACSTKCCARSADAPQRKPRRALNITINGDVHVTFSGPISFPLAPEELPDHETEIASSLPATPAVTVSRPAQRKPVTKDNVREGLRVRRGKVWKWDDQDGGEGKLGTITGPGDAENWWRVAWDHGSRNRYRVGHKGCFDLELAE